MKKVRYVLLPILCIMLLGGCNLIPTVQLNEADSVLVAEYAAGLLLKYDGDHENGLMEITDEPIVVETPEPQQPALTVGDEEADGTAVRDTSELVAPPELAAAIGIPDFQVSYIDYEICDIYPEQESDELVFSMQAQEGHDLLILHFDLTNPAAETANCDVVTKAPLFRAMINGNRVNSQTTILLNDLAVYSGMLEANETVDTVLVFEIEESTAANLDTLSLLIVANDGDFTYQLQ